MLTPQEQRALKQRLHDNPVFAQQFTNFRDSGDMDRAAKHLCIAYQLFTLANEHAESAYDIAARHGLAAPVYIGDTVMDERSAREAGCPFIHAAYGFGESESPDAVIAAPAALAAVIGEMEGRYA